MPQGEKVLDLAGMRLDNRRALRLELTQPVERPFEAIDPRERVEDVVGHDTDTGAARAERNQPHPVAAPIR